MFAVPVHPLDSSIVVHYRINKEIMINTHAYLIVLGRPFLVHFLDFIFRRFVCQQESVSLPNLSPKYFP